MSSQRSVENDSKKDSNGYFYPNRNIMIHEIGRPNSIFNQFLREIRDEKIQKDRARFRSNMERMGEIFAYEISKVLDYKTEEIITPLGVAVMRTPSANPVLATILRAGLPLHQGLLNYFDQADSAFISAYRKHEKNDGGFKVKLEYLSSPDLTGRDLIISDPMVATGSSMVLVHKALMTRGTPAHNHVVGLLATEEGLAHMRRNMPENTTFWIGAIDDELTAQAYIVPGLGDAGDLCYGMK
jgi:uracil phosphoribosyltransferase